VASDEETESVTDTVTTEEPSGSSSSRARPSARKPTAKSESARQGDAKEPITMLADRVLVHVPVVEGERRSRAGILIPATAAVPKRLAWAEVAAVGPHVRTIRAGDKVLFSPDECFEVDVQGEEYRILRERDIHAVATERLDSATGLYL
jgi:chaperonin GroES